MYEVKKDCFAYDGRKKNCNALNELMCKKEKCKFYKPKNEKKHGENCDS